VGKLIAVPLVLAVGVTACFGLFEPVPCEGPGPPAVVVDVRDDLGRPAALGTKLVVRDGSYADSAEGEWDLLTIDAAENRPGVYRVRISRPWYSDVEKNVAVPGDRCGVKTSVRVAVSLNRVPGAPPMRNVFVHPRRDWSYYAGRTRDYRAVVDADPGVDTMVAWTIDDTTVASLTSTGRATAQCRTSYGDAVITATSNADPNVRGLGYLRVYANASTCPP
jgi:hypothetical protein